MLQSKDFGILLKKNCFERYFESWKKKVREREREREREFFRRFIETRDEKVTHLKMEIKIKENREKENCEKEKED